MRVVLLIIISACIQFASAQVSIIPKPNESKPLKGRFAVKPSTIIVAPAALKFEGVWLQKAIKENFKPLLKLAPANNSDTDFIQLSLVKNLDKEAYSLNITPKGVHIMAGGSAGIFYGVQSFYQILMASGLGSVPCMIINDSPRFKWRGMHLDCCRHFFTTEEVKKYIDYLAMYKMNVFHWHLTDDQGWRIEIKQYPKLTEVGGWRKGTMVGHYRDQKWDTLTYGGFYTQEQIREVVKYAAERHITVVPEIEMPGHALAALAAFPEFSCNGGPFKTGNTWGVYDDVFCAGNDSTFAFLQRIMDEVLQLFPSEFIHIGGDECPKVRWKSCPKCQARIKAEGLKDEHELQSYFIQRMENYLNSKGRKIIGWDEILEGGLAPNAAVMSWRGVAGGIAAAKEKHFVVMSPGNPCYFDHYQFGKEIEQPVAIGGFNPIDSVYAFEPVPSVLSAEEAVYIMGAQANVWTEYITTFSHVEYMALPRMAALAEVLWTHSRNKDYKDFSRRLELNKHILKKKGINYARPIQKN